MADGQEQTTNIVFRQKEPETSPLTTMLVKGTPGQIAGQIHMALKRGERFTSFQTSAGKQLAIKVDRIESIADS